MSSMRNAITRRPHKERSQPKHREKWGLLEKHKDYSLRAADYNAKQAKLSILSRKSRERHPDEFAFGMLRDGAAQGKHGRQKDQENRLSHDAVRLLKSQDAGYLRVAQARVRREVGRVGEEVGLERAMKKGGQEEKVLFDAMGEPVRKRRRVSGGGDDDEEEEEEEDQDMGVEAVQIGTTGTLDEKRPTPVAAKPKPRKQLEREKDRLAQLKADRKRRKRLEDLRKAKLDVLKKRQKEIMAAADALELQRAKMSRTIGGVNKNGVKFKVRERKK